MIFDFLFQVTVPPMPELWGEQSRWTSIVNPLGKTVFRLDIAQILSKTPFPFVEHFDGNRRNLWSGRCVARCNQCFLLARIPEVLVTAGNPTPLSTGLVGFGIAQMRGRRETLP